MKYIFPPRPENKIPRSSLDKFDNGMFIAEPKFNGSCCEPYIEVDSIKIMNRHKNFLTGVKIKDEEFRSILDVGDGNLYVGEYMNKSKKDKFGNVFNHKFIIFDIIVLRGEHLIGKTFLERYNILLDLFDFISEDDLTYKISENIYLTKIFETNFCEIWDDITKIDMIEGLVLKKKNAKLETGITEKNNVKSQIKCRKETKNYSY